MKIYSCETHIDQALEEFIEKEEKFPMLKLIPQDEKLSTICAQCKTPAIYIVANE
ncbi:CxxH/CxxC protein [Sporosarcina sp. HYO08]|uniref:CxxH/CxxC protein n=1 Tax=Sporosarcina sp. HYO08 TaxID=1759557 RepID=UPI0020A44A15|nr:CxxH/CxxC protein [Sporosarcina sp. HYO08]